MDKENYFTSLISILSRFNFNFLVVDEIDQYTKFQSYQGSILTEHVWINLLSHLISILSRFNFNCKNTKQHWRIQLFQSYQGSILTSSFRTWSAKYNRISILSRFNFNTRSTRTSQVFGSFQSYQGSILTQIPCTDQSQKPDFNPIKVQF